jgi:hypothetical protein
MAEKKAKILESIAFWENYLADLRAGKPVENVSPSGDEYYLVPENIENIIECDKSLLKGQWMTIC